MADVEDDAPTLRLVIEKGPSEGRIQEFIPKSGSEIKIGRIIRGNTLSIKDIGISSKHASIRFDNSKPVGFWALSDLGSSNGTVLNERLLEPFSPVALSDGDIIKIGELTSIAVKLVEVRVRVEEKNARTKIPRRKGRNLEVVDLTNDSPLGKGDERKGNVRGRNTRGKAAVQRNEVAEVKGNSKMEMEAGTSNMVTQSGAGKENGGPIELLEVEHLGRRARSKRNVRKKEDNGGQDAEEMASLMKDQVREAPSCAENEVGGTGKDHDLEILGGNEVQNKDKEEQILSLRRSTRNSRNEKNKEKSSLEVNGEEKPQRRRGRRKNMGMETLTENDNEGAEKTKNSEKEVLLEDMKEGLREEGEGIHGLVEEEEERLQQLASEGCQAAASTSGLAKENDDEIEVDLEKMTLGEWFDFLDVHLPKQIIDETEEMILDMRQKSEKFHHFMLQKQSNSSSKVEELG